MDLVDSKYIGMISSRLQKFKRVKDNLYNFRCPICGDSQKNKNKTRGYIYQVKNNTNFKCHNCGASMSFSNFLKKMDTVMHKQYTLEKFKEGHTGRNFVVEEPKFDFKKPVFSANTPMISIPFSMSDLDISACGTPSKTSRKVGVSKCTRSSEVDFPNNILDALIAFIKASSL